MKKTLATRKNLELLEHIEGLGISFMGQVQGGLIDWNAKQMFEILQDRDQYMADYHEMTKEEWIVWEAVNWGRPESLKYQ